LDCRLRWVESGAALVAAIDHDDPVAALLESRQNRSHWPGHRDLTGLTRAEWLGLAQREPDWAAALACEYRDGLARTSFDLGKAALLDKLRRLPNEVAEEHLREALFGPWRYADSEYACGLDPSRVAVAARSYKLPSAIKAKRSVVGAIWLALEALPYFPVLLTDRGPRTTGWRDDSFFWPAWSAALTSDGIRGLLARQLPRPGVLALYASHRVRTAKTIQVLSPALRVDASSQVAAETQGVLAYG
jgi:hypothetical protein